MGVSIEDSKTSCRQTQHYWPTTPNVVARMLHPFAHPVACCCVLLGVIVVQSLKPIKLLSQQLPSFLLFRDRQSIEQQCCVLLHSSSIIVEIS